MKTSGFIIFIFFISPSACTGQNSQKIYYYNPQWSPDGKIILFESTMDGKSSIYTIYPDGSHLKKITDTIYNYGQPCWSPDGMSIVYYGSEHPMQLFINSVNGGNQKQLPTPGMDAYEASWSVHNKIAFDSRSPGQTPNDISVINADGTGLAKLTDGRYDYSSPSWSPDGSKILIERTIAVRKDWYDITPEERTMMSDSAEIMLMNADGSDIQNLTGNAVKDRSPFWSHDGNSMYYISDDGNRKTLMNMNILNQKTKEILDLKKDMNWINISPDEKYLTYVDTRENQYAIYIRNIKDRTERKLIGD